MTLSLYAHPFSSYCQKALIALYENAIAFEYRELGPDSMAYGDIVGIAGVRFVEFCRRWPGKIS